MSAPTEELIREFARDLAPVRPIPRLRSVFATALAAGLIALGTHWLLGGPGLRPGGAGVWSFAYLATLAGLTLVALAALGAAFAVAVPGREFAARMGTRVAGAGFTVAVTGGLWGVAHSGIAAPIGEEILACLSCFTRALAIGAVPVLLACAFIVYTTLRRPGLGTSFGVAGGIALGAAAVHATCPSDSALHWLLAHTLAPPMAILVLTVPLAALVARWMSRD